MYIHAHRKSHAKYRFHFVRSLNFFPCRSIFSEAAWELPFPEGPLFKKTSVTAPLIRRPCPRGRLVCIARTVTEVDSSHAATLESFFSLPPLHQLEYTIATPVLLLEPEQMLHPQKTTLPLCH